MLINQPPRARFDDSRAPQVANDALRVSRDDRQSSDVVGSMRATASSSISRLVGLTPQQHQALLAIKGFNKSGRKGEATIGDLADAL
jgi:hypothetical protein